ncbi:MAG: quinone-dependent dihydroorotate dehydrogenase [Chloroflexi bacterium]|nr:quinone-dependent dihydroorotate dehydrogenase [Chloroflexota bacterium]MQC47805.1 quinone-dependent dihydroorotate dehydrogenase [Chloroflexota bacterium]
MLYDLIRPLLFRLPPERAHTLTLRALRIAATTPAARLLGRGVRPDPMQFMGLDFPNRIGLAAGLDKNGDYIDALGALGFGFIEVGTVTPLPQPGNSQPRLFRLPEREAIINRMGFNNLGVDHLVAKVAAASYGGVIGINIGKNKDTPAERAVDDYVTCMGKAYPYAGYIAVNVSSPNTPGLRDLQGARELDELLAELTRLGSQFAVTHGRRVPLVLKVAPDLSGPQIEDIARIVLDRGVDGLIVGNTTVTRDGVEGHRYADETGGLSGRPLAQRLIEVQRAFAQRLEGQVAIIGVGGIMSGTDARAKVEAGADLVQVYSGLIYRGPTLLHEVSDALSS